MTYIQDTLGLLGQELTGLDTDLLNLYTLLVLTKGEEVTLEDVHDAWSVWRTQTLPDHRSIVPFKELSPEVQALDQPYADAIRRTARVVRSAGRAAEAL